MTLFAFCGSLAIPRNEGDELVRDAIRQIRSKLWRLAHAGQQDGRSLQTQARERWLDGRETSPAQTIPRRSSSKSLVLRDLFDAQGTDKGWYATTYEMLLRPYRQTFTELLEIGIGTLEPDANATMHGYAPDYYRPGGSLRGWRDFFTNARILGADIEPDTQFSDERIRTVLCDSTDSEAVRTHLGTSPSFDVIVDDGSHRPEHQLATLQNCFPLVRKGGFYFIEDVGDESPLYWEPALIEPHIDGAPYFCVSDSNNRAFWKLIVIQRLD